MDDQRLPPQSMRWKGNPKIKNSLVKISELKIDQKNIRLHDKYNLQTIKNSLQKLGQQTPIVHKKGIICKGNGTLQVAIDLGWSHISAIETDLDEKQLRDYKLIDNKSSDLSSFDPVLLKEEFEGRLDLGEDYPMFEEIGFDEMEVKGILEFEPEDKIEQDPDANNVPEMNKKTDIVLGDVFKLGDHTLLCGDCLDSNNVTKLLGSKQVNMLLTDPPYGVDYSSKNEMLNKLDEGNRIEKPIQNDDIGDYYQLFCDFLTVIPFATYNTIYCFMSSQELHTLRQAITAVGIKWGEYLVWVKNNHVLGRKDYNLKYEFILYGWKGKHHFYGKAGTTVLNFDRPVKSDLHPTMKPVELLKQLIGDGSRPTDLIYDPFGGSGSTMIACEKTKRKCYMMELDPPYCDVIIRRWEELTGKKAEKIN